MLSKAIRGFISALVMLVGWKLSSEAMTRVQLVKLVRLFAICRSLPINYGKRSSCYPSSIFLCLDMIVSKYVGCSPDFGLFAMMLRFFIGAMPICAAIVRQTL